MTIKNFKKYLQSINLSENTNASYLFAIKQFKNQYDVVSKKNLRAYKIWLIENFKPKTVNLRLRAINCYLEFIEKSDWKISFVRVQQKAFLENVISEADYTYFKCSLKHCLFVKRNYQRKIYSMALVEKLAVTLVYQTK